MYFSLFTIFVHIICARTHDTHPNENFLMKAITVSSIINSTSNFGKDFSSHSIDYDKRSAKTIKSTKELQICGIFCQKRNFSL